MKLNTLFEGFSKQIYSKPNESSDDEMALSAMQTASVNKKYELTKYSYTVSCLNKVVDVFRIVALRDFKPVDRDVVHKGDLGGYVQNEDNLSQTGNCWIADNAIVCEKARVSENAMLFQRVLMTGHSSVSGNAVVGTDIIMQDYASVSGNAIVYGNARLVNHADIIKGRMNLAYGEFSGTRY